MAYSFIKGAWVITRAICHDIDNASQNLVVQDLISLAKYVRNRNRPVARSAIRHHVVAEHQKS
jgi:hypothetical protein